MFGDDDDEGMGNGCVCVRAPRDAWEEDRS